MVSTTILQRCLTQPEVLIGYEVFIYFYGIAGGCGGGGQPCQPHNKSLHRPDRSYLLKASQGLLAVGELGRAPPTFRHGWEEITRANDQVQPFVGVSLLTLGVME